MSRADEDLREMIWLLQSLLDHAQYGMRVKTYDDCNNCKRSKCKYMPEPGQMVRINCPLWSNKDEEEANRAITSAIMLADSLPNC